jgi:hypothetical protein
MRAALKGSDKRYFELYGTELRYFEREDSAIPNRVINISEVFFFFFHPRGYHKDVT